MAQTRPNTSIHHPAYLPHQYGTPESPLIYGAWEAALSEYPDSVFREQLLGIIQYGAVIGYQGPRSILRIQPNLPIDDVDKHLITTEIESQLKSKAISQFDITNKTKTFISSPLGLVPKSDGTKRRIHHLSSPDGTSVNDFINPDSYTISYSTLDDAIQLIRKMGPSGGAIMFKRDLKDAFRHIPVSPLDRQLLGFTWEGTHYVENRLPFGLRSSPRLFNYFAEGLHWICEAQFGWGLIHYLDDFLFIFPAGTPPSVIDQAESRFDALCTALGLTIKHSKDQRGFIVDFAGFELNSLDMRVRLTRSKLEKAKALLSRLTLPTTNSIRLEDLQKLTGYFQFISRITPYGNIHLRYLYAAQSWFNVNSSLQTLQPRLYPNTRRRITAHMKEELDWWKAIVFDSDWEGTSIRQPMDNKPEAHLWTDAATTRGIGGFFILSSW